MWLFALLLCGAVTAAHCRPLRAAEPRGIRIETRRTRSEDGEALLSLLINGRTVISLLRADQPAVSLERTLAAAALNISRAYRTGQLDFTVESADDGLSATLRLNGEALLEAAESEAQRHGLSAGELAAAWQHELQAVLGLDAAAAPEKSADLPGTETDGGKPERFSMEQARAQIEAESQQLQRSQAAAEQGRSSRDREREPAKPRPKPVKKTEGKAKAPAEPAEEEPGAEPEPKPAPTSTGRVGQGGVQDVSLNELAPDPAFQRLMVSLGHRVYEPPLETQFRSLAPPAELVAQVTGPASEDAARIAVEWAIRAHTGTPISSRVSWRGPVLTPDEISELPKAKLKELRASFGEAPLRGELPPLATAPGKSRTVRLDYTISSIGEPLSGVVEVKIENRSLKLPRETYTWFSNAPEGVTQPQLLYYADLPVGVAGRLVYHHQNQGEQNLQFFARLVNAGSEVGAVHVIPGSCAPDINTYFVGYKSCENFWANLNTGAGYVLRIPPGSQAILCGQALPRGYTSSGYYKLTNLASCNLRIETVVLPAGHWPAESSYTRTELASSEVYPEPYYSEERSWSTGDDWLYLRLGQNAPQDLAGRTILHGMYGMTHSYSVDVTNTRSAPATVYVVLRGSAGEVKGQFFINDKYVVSQLVKGGDEQLLDQITLEPGASRRLKIIGIPLNGGFYPASIIIRDTKMP